MSSSTRKTVVITGASSGFGRGLALKLAQDGHRLVLAARREQVLRDLAAECGDAIAVPTDVSSEAGMRALAEAAAQRYGGFDVWVNNAGVAALGKFGSIPLGDHRRMVEVNLIGTMIGSWLALQRFRAQGHGTLVNVASLVGKVAAPYYNSYSATKFAIDGLSRSLREELRLEGLEDVHVCVVAPLAADTPFFTHAGNYTGHELRPAPPVYAPERVVEAMAALLERPQDEVTVGTVTSLTAGMAGLLPGPTERVMAGMVQKSQYEDAPPAPPTAGNLHVPIAAGTGVTGTIREQMARQDAERK